LDAARKNPTAAQAELLAEILRENAATRFGRAHRFEALKSLGDYRAAVPVAQYDAFAADVEALWRGERDLLFPGAPIFFAQTSGSSGVPKRIAYPSGVEA